MRNWAKGLTVITEGLTVDVSSHETWTKHPRAGAVSKKHVALRPQKRGGLLGTGTGVWGVQQNELV